MAFVIVCLLGAGLAAVTPGGHAEEQGRVLRILPADAGCGEVLRVSIQVEPPAGSSAWFVKEVPPPGVEVVVFDERHHGHLDENGTLSWVSTAGGPATLSYEIKMPQNGTGRVDLFDGAYRFHDQMEERRAIGGANALELRCGSVLRVLPAMATCGTTIEIEISLAPPSGTDSWVLEEKPPTGWVVVDVDTSDNGQFVAENGVVKWVSTSGGGSLKSYTLEVPSSVPDGTNVSFAGTYRFHPGMTDRVGIDGDQELTIDCPPSPPPGTVPSVDDLIPAEPGAPFVTRFLPREVQCGQSFFVGLGVAPPLDTSSWVLVESPAAQTVIGHVDPANQGEWVASLGDLKWVSLSGASSVLVYQLMVPLNVTDGTVLGFTGESRAHPHMAERVPVIGHENVTVHCPSSRGGGGGGGGGQTLSAGTFELGAPGGPPTELLLEGLSPPAGALWHAATPPLSGVPGGEVRMGFPDDPDGLEVVFRSGSVLDGAVIKVTRWSMVPGGVGGLPQGFDVAAILSIEIDGGPHHGHHVEVAVQVDDAIIPVPVHGAIMSWETSEWGHLGPAWIEQAANGSRLVATGTCCSIRVIGFDLADPEVDIRIIEDATTETLRIETTIVDNLGIAVAELYHNGSYVARLDAPRGGYLIDLERLDAGDHLFEVRVTTVTGRMASSTVGWTHVPLGPAEGDPVPIQSPSIWPWILLTMMVLLGVLGVLTMHRRKSREELEAALGAPALSLSATEEKPPEGALMARRILVTGTKGSGANMLLDDPDVPTIALFLGENLEKVPLDVSKWPPTQPPPGLAPFPVDVGPLILLRVALPPEKKGAYPVLVTIALPEEEVLHPSWIALLAPSEDEWATVDRFKFTLDPDGMYRGSALAEDQGWLLVGLRSPNEGDVDPADG